MNQVVHKQFELDLITKSIHICFSMSLGLVISLI